MLEYYEFLLEPGDEANLGMVMFLRKLKHRGAGFFNVQLHTKCAVLKKFVQSTEKHVQFTNLLLSDARV